MIASRTLTLIVPAYNEALTLMSSLTTLHEYLAALEPAFVADLIVVDDGSKDETGAIAEAFASTRSNVSVIHHAVNSRLGEAMRTGIAASAGEIVVVFDSDLTYSPDHIGRMIAALDEHHADVVIASPYMKGGRTTAVPFLRKLSSQGANRILAMNTNYDVKTVTGMVRAYKGELLRALNLKTQGPEINAEILYKAQIMRARVVEIPAHLDWSNQAERMARRRVSLTFSNTSKLTLFSSFLFRPIFFFIVPGLLLAMIAAWTLGSLALTVLLEARAAWRGGAGLDASLTEGFRIAWQVRPQSFIIGGISLVIAVQLVSLGMLATQSKRYFEELFHQQTTLIRRLRGAERDRDDRNDVDLTSDRR